MFFFVITMIYLSGLFTPFQNMPQWAQMLGNASPLKYFIQVLRMTYLKGATFFDMQHLFYPLCALAVFFNGWAVLSIGKRVCNGKMIYVLKETEDKGITESIGLMNDKNTFAQ